MSTAQSIPPIKTAWVNYDGLTENAHGFLVLSETADVLYKATAYWAPQLERVIHWNDPQLAIPWPLAGEPLLSSKDAQATRFSGTELYQ